MKFALFAGKETVFEGISENLEEIRTGLLAEAG
jgi:hypothetical protein